MSIIMPFGKVYGMLMSFLFAVLSIGVYDLITSGIGIWTLITSFTYGVVAIGAFLFFKNKSGWKNYAMYSIIATIFFDAITGLIPGPMFYNQPFISALIGQIPFTFYHLIGNTAFAIILSPAIEGWLLRESPKPFYLTSSVKGI